MINNLVKFAIFDYNKENKYLDMIWRLITILYNIHIDTSSVDKKNFLQKTSVDYLASSEKNIFLFHLVTFSLLHFLVHKT